MLSGVDSSSQACMQEIYVETDSWWLTGRYRNEVLVLVSTAFLR